MSSHPGVRALLGVLAPCRRSSEGAPLDVAGAAEAERRLGIRLPSDYIAFMETYGAGSIGGDSLLIAAPYSASGGNSVVGMAELFWEQAPEHYSHLLPAGVSADMLIRWGFTEDCAHLFWLMTGEDSDAWPIVELQEDGGPFTVHGGGFADYLRAWCTTAAETLEFMHWREHDHLVEQGLNPSTGLPWGV
ncbi:SMI1/KNR4 family protein [Kitasatospora sp. NPDC089913]|uniref:SMI1/KNR4 family protein n=1 Tax=Kitasatospora sp. NPDC089913 TaxID=3364080 RepID=UPI00380C57D1